MITAVKFLRTFLAAVLFAAMLPIPPAAAASGGTVIVKTVKYSDFEAAATTDTVVLYETKGAEVIERVVMIVDTDFSGGSISAYTISVGKSGSATKYLAATTVFTDAANGTANGTVGSTAGIEARGVQIIATATSTTANLSTATAGQATFLIFVSAAGV